MTDQDTLELHRMAADEPAPDVSPDLPAVDLQTWGEWAQAARQDLRGLPDLASQLLEFVAKKS